MKYGTPPSLVAVVFPDQPRHGDSYPIVSRWADAKAERDKIAGHYDEAIGFAYPGRAGINSSANSSRVYDDTAVIAAPEFASAIQAGVMPNYARWASHIAGVLIDDEEERAELREALAPVDAFIFQMISTSNAGGEIHESLLDLAVGTGCLRIDPGIALHPLNVRAVPLRALSFCVGVDGRPDAIFEERHMTLSELDVDYSGIKHPPTLLSSQPSPDLSKPTKIKVVEAWWRDWTDARGGKWRWCVFYPESNGHIGIEGHGRGAGSCPYIGPFRWSKGSGEPWGRGPLYNCLPSMRTLNYAMSALLDHMDFALAGVWNVEDDGVVNVDTIRLEPGTLIPKAPGSSGLTNMRPSQDFSLPEYMIEGHRKQVRRALYTDELGDPDRSPKTATEVQHRMANMSRRVGSSYGRLLVELVIPFVERCVYILKRRGLIALPVIDGQNLAMFPASTLAQTQAFEDIEQVDRWISMLQARFGPQAALMMVDQNETAAYLAERLSVPPRLLRKPDAQAEVVKAISGMQDGGGGAEGTEEGAAPI